MTNLTRRDRSLVETWRKHGIPDDQTTVDAALRVIVKAIDDLDEVHAILEQVGTDSELRARDALRAIRGAGCGNSRVVAGAVAWGLGESDEPNGLADPGCEGRVVA